MYPCKFYKGDYRERQGQANADRCAAYVEHHFNSSASPTAGYANDRGAPVVGGGWEADYAQQVLLKAQAMLEDVVEPQREREIRVVAGDAVLFRQIIDVDADVTWDGVRGILRVDRSIPASAPRTHCSCFSSGCQCAFRCQTFAFAKDAPG